MGFLVTDAVSWLFCCQVATGRWATSRRRTNSVLPSLAGSSSIRTNSWRPRAPEMNSHSLYLKSGAPWASKSRTNCSLCQHISKCAEPGAEKESHKRTGKPTCKNQKTKKKIHPQWLQKDKIVRNKHNQLGETLLQWRHWKIKRLHMLVDWQSQYCKNDYIMVS